MAKTGRNEQCPCGSGRKYKKCCLDKDEAGRGQERETLDRVVPHDEPMIEAEGEDVDPYMDEVFERFKEAGFDERVTLFQEVLSQSRGTTDDLFGLVDLLRQAQTGPESRRQVNRCLAELRRQRPDCWGEDGSFYANYFIVNALATGDTAETGDYFLLSSRQVDRHIDVYCNTVDLLSYHGQHQALTEGLRLALPLVQKSQGLMPWMAGEMALRLVDCEVLAWVEAGATEADFGDLLKMVQDTLPNLTAGNLLDYAEHLAGRRTISAEALFDKKKRLDLEQLSLLTVTFAGYLSRVRNVPGMTALLACGEIFRYLMRRDAGELKTPKRSALVGKARGVQHGAKLPVHPLCPDPDTLDYFFTGRLHFLSSDYHALAVLALSLPAWHDFLAEINLLEEDQVRGRVRLLVPLIETLTRVIAKGSGDPAMAPAVQKAWQKIC